MGSQIFFFKELKQAIIYFVYEFELIQFSKCWDIIWFLLSPPITPWKLELSNLELIKILRIES